MAGGRRGWRKPGQDEPGDDRAIRDDGQDPEPGQLGYDMPGESGDDGAEQWLSPFRIGRPVTPVVSRRDSRPEPLRAEPILAEPVRVDPVRADPLGDEPPRQVWHDA